MSTPAPGNAKQNESVQCSRLTPSTFHFHEFEPMRPEIEAILSSLRRGHDIPGNDAPLLLGMMIERFDRGNVCDPTYKLLIPEHLLALSLTNAEVDTILKEMAAVLSSEKYSLKDKAAIAQSLGKSCRLEAFETVLRFLFENQNNLDNEAVCHVLVGITPSSFPEDSYPVVLELIERYSSLSALERLYRSKTDRVSDLSRRIINSIRRMKGQGPLLSADIDGM